jgi:hypothetical protein
MTVLRNIKSVSPISKSADRRQLAGVGNRGGPRVGNPRYSRLGSLRYEFLSFSAYIFQPLAFPAARPKKTAISFAKICENPSKTPHRQPS